MTEGSVSISTITTANDGKATMSWTLGTTVDLQTLTVTAFKADGAIALTGSPLLVTATRYCSAFGCNKFRTNIKF